MGGKPSLSHWRTQAEVIREEAAEDSILGEVGAR